MSPLLRKEIRLLLPTFVIGLGLTLALWLIPRPERTPTGFWLVLLMFPYVCAPALGIMLALDSLGREVSSGTFSNLLAQPVARERIWWTKTLLLAMAMGILLNIWLLAFYRHSMGLNPGEAENLTTVSVLFTLAAYSGALWTVLVFRQVAAAFWFTVLTPIALMLAVGNWMDRHGYSEKELEQGLIITLIVYSIAGFLFAWRMFIRAQDVPWKGRSFSLPAVGRFPELLVGRGTKRTHRPRLALLLKEIQLHHSLLLLAGLLAVVHFGVILARFISGGFKSHPMVQVVADNFWVLWLALPLLVGCAAIAEERKVGALEGQLCLPARRRTQFVFKFGVALLLCVLLGAVMPLLLEGKNILPQTRQPINVDEIQLSAEPDSFGANITPKSVFWLTLTYLVISLVSFFASHAPFFILAIASIIVGILSFYASSLARSTLQALGPAVLSLLAGYFVVVAAAIPEVIFGYPLWRGGLVYLIGVPFMILVLIGLMYSNYKRVLAGVGLWQRNLIALIVALGFVGILTTAVYHRVWELVETLEPPHAAARLTQSQKVTLRSEWGHLIVQLPDGRVRISQMTAHFPNLAALLTIDPAAIELFGGGRFLEGTNWAIVATTTQWEIAAIQTDGTLWISDPAKRHPLWAKSRTLAHEPVKLSKFGDDHDWKSVTMDMASGGILLLKTNGTLWHLGSDMPSRSRGWPGLHTLQPTRLGTNADWAGMVAVDDHMVLTQTNGQAWLYPPMYMAEGTMMVNGRMSLQRVPILDRFGWRSMTWGVAPGVWSLLAMVYQGGTMHACDPGRGPYMQLGTETNWCAVSGNSRVIVSLKNDGSFWRWDFPENPTADPESASALRASTHSDWIAIAPAQMGGVVSLSADGGLWYWRFEELKGESSGGPYLFAPSRKPHLIANIFDQ